MTSPGCLIAVVGPSGAGKDTILRGAQRALADDPRFVFARRWITRPADATEDSIGIDVTTFQDRASEGAFLLWWQANGLFYGLSAMLSDDLAEGRNVVANVSREIVPEIRERFPTAMVVLVTAGPEILASRLAARQRENAAMQNARLGRNAALAAHFAPDRTIENNGEIVAAIGAFTDVLRDAARIRVVAE